ncbi:LysR family transcriptional regulator [Paraferrimonas sedimenticola]|uniref:LysR family transcriptional regulator n=1 Tax=Paraferrimonas sedimenticola TaxID=375674 RepID=A0AA37RT93_9GAMM|nr:LysR family transcriptional regulator [Paraferrimonas sedimenticola]GLP95475.1 LysR family transcriptional regulator [Paraferrimonas sedimenticola]
MLNPKWLNTFKVLAELGHFGQTAKALHMTQPGVSQHLAKLESELGVQLLLRDSGDIRLTTEGRRVYQHAQQQAHQHQNLMAELSHDDPYSGHCYISCSGALANYCYPDWLKYLLQHPNLSLSLEAAPNHRIERDLLSGEMQLGVMSKPCQSNELSQSIIGEEALEVFVPKDFNQSSGLQGLLELGFIDHPDGQYYWTQVSRANFDAPPKTPPISGYVNQLAQILLPVAAGLGFSVLPASVARRFEASDKITSLKVAQPVYEARYLTQSSHQALPQRYTWFVDYLSALSSAGASKSSK